MRRLLAFFGLDPGPTDEDFLHGELVSPSTIGGGMTIKGELRGEGPLTVLGQFEGDIVLDGTLHVGPEARVDANITARAIVIAGVVHGNLSADTRVEILPTGALTGTVKSGSFTAADGARVKGEIWVERPVEDRRLPAVHA
jgi:cytoskeletal protein CcmA (bactofilin family)